MASRKVLVLPLLVLALALSTNGGAQMDKSPVLVELFTSQGCSSCPPAEAWLNGKGQELFEKGAIIPLAFHVDYWDYLGWKDPFSQAAFSERQRLYGPALGDGGLYTPQMVVGGRAGFVGSDGQRALREIAAAQGWPGSLSLHFAAQRDAKGFLLQIRLGEPKVGVRLFAAVFTNGEVTKVGSGENGGRTLTENFVVRKLVELDPRHHGGVFVDYPAPVRGEPPAGLAVFAQDSATLRVLAARCLYPIGP